MALDEGEVQFGQEDQAGWVNPEKMNIPKNLPKMALWRVMVCPMQPLNESRGTHGKKIVLPSQTLDNQQYLGFIGKLVGVGPLAGLAERYKHPKTGVFSWDFRVGDLVIYGRYGGQRLEIDGIKLLILNDDELMATVKTIKGIRAYV